MEKYFVYIIYSQRSDCYYKGFTLNPTKRLNQHNTGESNYTSKSDDWKIIHLEIFANKSLALKREKSLKKYSKSQILELIKTSKNKLHEFG